jgi:Tol biopolymer transport system component
MYSANPVIPSTSSYTYLNFETAPRYCMVKNKPWIVFSENIGSRQIYMMKADDPTTLVRLPEAQGDTFPDWSPDCSKIIYVQEYQESLLITHYKIYSQDLQWTGNPITPSADGNSTLLIHYQNEAVSSPHYSPDGSKIVFVLSYVYIPTSTLTPTQTP